MTSKLPHPYVWTLTNIGKKKEFTYYKPLTLCLTELGSAL